MNELQVINNQEIERMIFEVRGKFVMLDSDIANLYHVETKRVNEAVKNNLTKFPERYSFKLTDEESKKSFGRKFRPKKRNSRRQI